MDDLVAFLAARYAEAWREARDRDLAAGISGLTRATREVEAKRAILALHREIPADDIDWSACSECRTQTYPCSTLRLAGTVYSDHPDYQPGWSPQDQPTPAQ